MKQKKLLVIGTVFPEPKSSAAGTRMMQLLVVFLNEGFKITFASTAQNFEFSENLASLDISIKIIELNSTSFDDFVKELNPNIVLFDRFMTEEQFGWRIAKYCNNALRILDTEDLHCLRLARQQSVKSDTPFELHDIAKLDIFKREIASIYRCDISLFVSDFEIHLLKTIFKVPENLLYYLPIFAKKNSVQLKFEEKKDFIFIGNFFHNPNTDAVLYIKDKLWKKIRNKLPAAKMLVYGAYTTKKIEQLHNDNENFYIMGRADNAQEVISKSRVMLAPLRFGAGIKGKLLESMQFGTPSITTSIGAEAMSNNNYWNGFVANDDDAIIEKAILLYQDKNIWSDSCKTGFEILETKFDELQFTSNFIQHILYLNDNLENHRQYNFVGNILQYHTMQSTKFMAKWIKEKNKKLQ